MKKLFSLLTLAMLTLSAMAATTVTFTIDVANGQNTSVGGADKMSLDGITVNTTAGAFNATEYRFGAGSTTTFSSEAGTITNIEFTCTADNDTKYGAEDNG